MLVIPGNYGKDTCDGYSRRAVLRVGSSAIAGLSTATLLEKAAGAAEITDEEARYGGKGFGSAKSVIMLYLQGGPSHLDLFDPKPKLKELAGQPLPPSFGKVITAMGTANNSLMPSQRVFAQHGQSGLWVSDWLPNIAHFADDLCLIRSCQADGLNHVGSVCQMNTGSVFGGRPSLGAWVSYGLGSENENLPGFMTLCPGGYPIQESQNWQSGFLPGVFQGTYINSEHTAVDKLIGDYNAALKLARTAALR